MAFERFTGRGKSYVPKASIWKRGQIGLTQGAVERFKLKEFRYLVMFYDKERNIIGLKFTNDEQEEGAARMRVRDNGAVLTAKSFLECYEINYKEENKQYDITFDPESSFYVIDLNKPNKK